MTAAPGRYPEISPGRRTGVVVSGYLWLLAGTLRTGLSRRRRPQNWQSLYIRFESSTIFGQESYPKFLLKPASAKGRFPAGSAGAEVGSTP
jgi:hypothetical protein